MRWLILTTVVFAPLVVASCRMDHQSDAEMTILNADQPKEKEKSLDADLRFDVGSVEISGEKDSSSLYSFNLEYDKSIYQPDVRYETAQGGEAGRLYFRLGDGQEPTIRGGRQNNRLRVSFDDSVELKFQLKMGIGESRLSLSGLKLAGLDLESGVGGTKLSAYEPNPIECDLIRFKAGVGAVDAVGLGNLHFRELDFEGGVGGATLDFSGDWKQDAQIQVQVGVGGVNAKVPRDIGVKVEAESHLLSGLHLEGFTTRGAFHFSENYEKAKIHVSVKVATGVGGFKITWI